LSKTLCRLIFAAAAALAAAPVHAAELPARVIPVEVWTNAHDDLTDRLSAAVSIALNDSQGFALSFGKKPGSLYVTITESVHWKAMGERAQLTAPVTIADRPPNAPPLVAQTVSCRDDKMLDCGGQVVALAKTVSGRGQMQPAHAERTTRPNASTQITQR
jgi:hypothetical protein